MRIYYHNRNLLEAIESGVHARSLLEALRRRGHELLIYPQVSHAGSNPSAARRLFQRLPNHLRDWRAIAAAHVEVRRHWDSLKKRIHDFRPDAIYLRTNYADLMSLKVAAEFPALPLVLEVNGLIHEELRSIGRPRLARFARSIEQDLWQRAEAIRVVSGELKSMLAEAGVAPRKIHVIYNGADARAFQGVDGTVERKALSIAPGDVVFCYIGSFRPFHGLDDMVEAARKIAPQSRNVRFLMVGDGPRRVALERMIEEAGLASRFVFTGAVPHERIPLLLAASDVCLSIYPAGQRMYFCPLKLIEYLAAGKAVLASEVGVQRELLRHGDTAWLAAVGDVDALARSIESLAGDTQLRDALGRNARRLVEERLTWEHTAAKIEKLLGVPPSGEITSEQSNLDSA